MKLSEFPPMQWHDRQLWTLTADNKPGKPADCVGNGWNRRTAAAAVLGLAHGRVR